MRGLLHDAARKRRGVLDVFDAPDRAAGKRFAVHHASVEREPAEPVREAAEADRSADRVIVFHGLRSGHGAVERRVALREQLERGFGGEFAEWPGGDNDGLGHGGVGCLVFGVLVFGTGGGFASGHQAHESTQDKHQTRNTKHKTRMGNATGEHVEGTYPPGSGSTKIRTSDLFRMMNANPITAPADRHSGWREEGSTPRQETAGKFCCPSAVFC